MEAVYRLEAEYECRLLLFGYARCIDEGDPAVAELFSADGIWDRPPGPLHGRDAISAEIDGRSADLIMRHAVTNFTFSLIDADHAVGHSHYISFRDPKPSKQPKSLPRPLSQPAFVGDYECKFVRTAAGWKIELLRFVRIFESASAH
jgi:SnoaL-like domain